LLLKRGGGGCIGLSAVTLSSLAVQAQLYPKNVMAFRLMGVFRSVYKQESVILLVLESVGEFVERERWGAEVPISAHLGGLLFGIVVSRSMAAV
jgi:hypothetical protein